MYEYEDVKSIFKNWENYNDGDVVEINGNKVTIVGQYNKGYDSGGECEILLIISINGETYATTLWSSSYERCDSENLFPVTKKTKVVEYWE